MLLITSIFRYDIQQQYNILILFYELFAF